MERIQKILARGGLASRRNAEQLITEGRVRVNGRVVSELGAKADPRDDKIEVDGKRVVAEHAVYIVLHKPRGVVATMSDPEGRPTVAEILKNVGARVFPVGRLDFATSGVLLATNDGEMSDGLLHPKKAVPKTYIVKVNGKMKKEDLDRWREGVQLEDGKTIPAEAKVVRFEGDKTWFELTIKEGRNQQIRRMGEATRFPVMRLARLSFASVTAEGLRPGQWRHMTRDELVQLKKTYGVPRSVVSPPAQDHAPARRTRSPEPKRGPAARNVRARGEEREPLPTYSKERFTARDRVAGARAARPHGEPDTTERATREERSASREERPAARENRPAREGAAPSRGRSDRTDRPAREGAPSFRSDRDDRAAREGAPSFRDRSDRPAPRGDRPAPRGGRPAPRGDRPAPRGDRSAPREDRPAPPGDRPAPRGDRPAPREGATPRASGSRPTGGRSDRAPRPPRERESTTRAPGARDRDDRGAVHKGRTGGAPAGGRSNRGR